MRHWFPIFHPALIPSTGTVVVVAVAVIRIALATMHFHQIMEPCTQFNKWPLVWPIQRVPYWPLPSSLASPH